MKNKFANPRRKTAQFQLTSRFSLILFGLLILFNVLFILLSVGYLFEHIENRASNILEAIENGEASGDDWNDLVNAYVSADEEDALQVILADGSVKDGSSHFWRASSLQMMVSIIRKPKKSIGIR